MWAPPAARLVLLIASVCAVAPTHARAAAPETGSRAVLAEYDGIIHPVAAEFFGEVIDSADTSNATVVVLVLRTPGGLLDSTRAIVSRIIAARTPVIVFVGPSGARASSAGFIIALAADIVAMAPGTHIGAAHPVSAGGEPAGNETMAKKAASDAAAYARTLADARRRNVTLAADAVIESRSFTEREALSADPPLIDLVAPSVAELLREIDGRQITRFDGRTTTLHTAGIVLEQREMTRRQQFLSAIAHPQIAYLLLTLGMLGLTVELWNPGAVLPGVAGGLFLLLAFFAFQVLPLNTVGVLLVAFGLALLVLELKVPSFGVLGIGGTLALLIGSLMLTREVPGVRVGYSVIVPAILAVAGVFLFLGRLAMQAQQMRPVTGAEGLLGQQGRTLTPLSPGEAGQVSVHGEIWRAMSDVPMTSGRLVRVTAMSGLTLRVDPVDSDMRNGG